MKHIYIAIVQQINITCNNNNTWKVSMYM